MPRSFALALSPCGPEFPTSLGPPRNERDKEGSDPRLEERGGRGLRQGEVKEPVWRDAWPDVTCRL